MTYEEMILKIDEYLNTDADYINEDWILILRVCKKLLHENIINLKDNNIN